MMDLILSLVEQIRIEALGFLGGIIFFGSWLIQAAESRRAGRPVVSARFFWLRALASALLAYEGIRAGSLSVFLMMVATGALMLYNIWLIKSGRKAG